jgi:hypothetical protein
MKSVTIKVLLNWIVLMKIRIFSLLCLIQIKVFAKFILQNHSSLLINSWLMKDIILSFILEYLLFHFLFFSICWIMGLALCFEYKNLFIIIIYYVIHLSKLNINIIELLILILRLVFDFSFIFFRLVCSLDYRLVNLIHYLLTHII